MRQMCKSMKGLLAAALGLALLAPQANADEPKNSNPPAPAKKVEPKTTKDTKEAHKVTKKVKPATPAMHTKKVHKVTKKVKPATQKDPKKGPTDPRKVKPTMPKVPKKAPDVSQASH
jgi:hypothetical protein